MWLLKILPAVEVLIFNSLSMDVCFKRKYSRSVTALVLTAVTVGIFACGFALAKPLNYQGDGKMMLVGFIYLPVLYFLYNGRLSVLFTLMCSCWGYTLGIFSLAFLCSSTWFDNSFIHSLIIETFLFLVTFPPFYRWIVPRYVFVLKNLPSFDGRWNKYMTLSNGLLFAALAIMYNVLLRGEGSVPKIFLLILILLSILVSNFTLYRVVLDSIKMNHLKQASLRDSLTGLGNRANLWNRLNTLLEGNETFSVLFMDLDRFKSVNDQYGHLVGDAYLKHFADVSSGILAEQGTVYRFGGDEFVAIYYGAVPENVLGELRECRLWKDGAPCPFQQVSIGSIICRPPHEDNTEALLHKVDRMMYEQKRRSLH